MPSIGQTARVTKRGADLPDVHRAELGTNAWLVWQYVREQITDQTAITMRQGVSGYTWSGSLTRVMGDLWPSLRDEYLTNPADGLTIRRRLNHYLRSSMNLVCLDRGYNPPAGTGHDTERRLPTWWVRKDWNPTEPTLGTQVVLTRDERKIDKSDAGEDRAPAPVESMFMCRDENCGRTFPTQAARAGHEKVHKHEKERRDRQALTEHATVVVEKVVRRTTNTLGDRLTALLTAASPQILSVAEIVRIGPSNGILEGHTRVQKTLMTLARDPQSSVQFVFPDGSKQQRYRVGAPLPEDAAQSPFLCREPECGKRFTSAFARRSHEESNHKHSLYRQIKCRECGETFYNSQGWGVHAGRLHSGKLGYEELPYPDAAKTDEADETEKRTGVPVTAPLGSIHGSPRNPLFLSPTPDLTSKPVTTVTPATPLTSEEDGSGQRTIRVRVADALSTTRPAPTSPSRTMIPQSTTGGTTFTIKGAAKPVAVEPSESNQVSSPVATEAFQALENLLTENKRLHDLAVSLGGDAAKERDQLREDLTKLREELNNSRRNVVSMATERDSLRKERDDLRQKLKAVRRAFDELD